MVLASMSLTEEKMHPNPYSIEQMASDTLYVLMELALENLYLYGHSQGVMITQSMVLQEQERIN